jgi:beta-fructofuranosidase
MISLARPGATHLQSESHLSDSRLAPLPAERQLRLRVFLDRSVIEVFVNDRVALSTRVYPTRADSLGVELFVEGRALWVESVEVWQMGAVWPD